MTDDILELEKYCESHLDESVWPRLSMWCHACGPDYQLKFVLRNAVRECRRSDIDKSLWNSFLTELANEIGEPVEHAYIEEKTEELAKAMWEAEGKPIGRDLEIWFAAKRQLFATLVGSQADPIEFVGAVLAKNGKKYSLPGKPIEVGELPSYVRRYVGLRQFLKYNLGSYYPATTRVADYAVLAKQIERGDVGGREMRGTCLGKTPVWCTDDLSTDSLNADDVRDGLGMMHITGDRLIEIRYPVSILEDTGDHLRAPTFLDACADGALNWIFAKRRDPGGPDWGRSICLRPPGRCSPGFPEAVHDQIEITDSVAQRLAVRVVGPVSASPPATRYVELYANEDI